MKKETLILLIILLVFFKGFSQSFLESDVKKINYFGIKTDSFDLNNVKIKTDFSEIIKLNRKRKSNKIFGIILGSISVLTTSVGILALSVKKKDGMSKAIVDTLGGFSLGIGIVSGGFSIKLFGSSKKRAKERNRLIRIYQ